MNFILPKASVGVPLGIYKAKFLMVENVPPNLDRGFGAGLKFVFEITEGEFIGKKVSRICSIASGENANLPPLLLGIMKVMPKAGSVDLTPFVGKTYSIMMGEKRVETISPLW